MGCLSILPRVQIRDVPIGRLPRWVRRGAAGKGAHLVAVAPAAVGPAAAAGIAAVQGGLQHLLHRHALRIRPRLQLLQLLRVHLRRHEP